MNNTIPTTATNRSLVASTSTNNESTASTSYITLTPEQLSGMNNYQICEHIYRLLKNYEIQPIPPSEIRRLVSFCENIDELLIADLTLLNTASCFGLTDIVHILINAGANVNIGDDNNYTPLYNASKNGHSRVVEILLQADAEIDNPEIDGRTPLCASVFYKQPRITDILINAGADINYQSLRGNAPLHDAAWIGDRESLNLLINAGVDIFQTDKNGRTALHNAAWAYQNRKIAVPILISKGLNPNQADSFGTTPVNLASRHGNTEALQQLMDAGGIVTGQDLLNAAKYGYFETVVVLLGNNVDVTYTDIDQNTALHVAALGKTEPTNNNCCHAEVIKILGDAGANVHIYNGDGMTPLHVAIDNDEPKPDIVMRLIEICADINQPTLLKFNEDQSSSQFIKDKKPLHLSVEKGHESITMLLLVNNANVNLTDKHGRTPLHIAVTKGSPDTVQLLVDAGADTDPVDIISKETPLYKAVRCVRNSTTDQLKRTYTDIIKILTKAGADLDKTHESIRDVTRNTPFKIMNNFYTPNEIKQLLELKPKLKILRDRFSCFSLFNINRVFIRELVSNSPKIHFLPLPEKLKNRIRANHSIKPSLTGKDPNTREIEPAAASETKSAKNTKAESLPRTQDKNKWTTSHKNRRIENKDFIERRSREVRKKGFGSTEPSKIKRDPNKFKKTFEK